MQDNKTLFFSSIVIDTNILIAYLGGDSDVIAQIQDWRKENKTVFISAITECELFSYPKLSEEELIKIERFLQENFSVISFSVQRARHAAMIRREISKLKLPDAAIAALALELRAPLVTRNIRDFKKVPDLTLIEI